MFIFISSCEIEALNDWCLHELGSTGLVWLSAYH